MLHYMLLVRILWGDAGVSMGRVARLCWARVCLAEAETAAMSAACPAGLEVLRAQLAYTILFDIHVNLTLSKLCPIWVSWFVTMESNRRWFSRLKVYRRPFPKCCRRSWQHRVYRCRKDVRFHAAGSCSLLPRACASEAGQETSRLRRRGTMRSNGIAPGAERRGHGWLFWQPGSNSNPCCQSYELVMLCRGQTRIQASWQCE